MRKCTTCKIDKEETEFFFRNKKKGILHHICKSCKRLADKKCYDLSEKRKSKMRKNAIEAVNRNRTFIRRLKKKLKCEKCGDTRYYVLDFHHNRDKKFGVSELAGRGCSLLTLKNEIRKCKILCSNCHREEHFLKVQKLTG